MKSIIIIASLLKLAANYAIDDCNPEYYQCGGESWTGSTCCNPGLQCKKINELYSYCAPENDIINSTVEYNSNITDSVIGIEASVNTVTSSLDNGGYALMNGGTTGGEGGEVVIVSDYSSLNKAVKGDKPKIVKINGIITLSADLDIGSNTSIIGIGKNSGVTGAGLKLSKVNNIIIQNLNISYCLGSKKDCISGNYATNVWVDHCEIYNDKDHDKDYYDGLIDFTQASDYITISWNYLHDHYKTSLIGHSDRNASEDTGKLHITYHHNYFKNTSSRLPSLRFGTGHIYNNIYEDVDNSCINVRMGAQALIEGNVFRNVYRPIVTDLYSNEGGYAVSRNNDFDSYSEESNPVSSVGNLTSVPYSCEIDDVTTVYNNVKKNAGPQ
ncbi:pectin lyase-like protein [Anaeromyces robustus]|uniref:Pectin lyase-like protein n=1 Tax=Anaeromyces robustus TaxID=1754192 RepID=A0A1Y1WVZ2_9FUNG|nr:pectin lyase-like protein [Anaeromyces robustus]|eukprot:ORX77565.1 pectin lyase-like protein [Anaeromyces robustus]